MDKHIIPQFHFSINDINIQTSKPNRSYNSHQNTNVKKKIIENLLQLFKPQNPQLCGDFYAKKTIISNVIDLTYKNNLKHQNSNTFQRSNSLKKKSQHMTPKRSMSQQKTNYSTSAKLNYSTNEQKFTSQERQKLRKRSGYYK